MVYKKSFYSKILIHPGYTLKDILDADSMTQLEFSLRANMSTKHVSNIIKGKASITTETALVLEKIFWMSAEFWNNLQKSYDEDLSRLKEQEMLTIKVEEDKQILQSIKEWYKNLAEYGFVENVSFRGEKNKEQVLNNLYWFFQVSSLKNIKKIFNIPDLGISFKKTESLKLNEYSLACWLRAWEIKVKSLDIGDYSITKLKKVLILLKEMTQDDVVDISRIQILLADAGIYFAFVQGFTKVPVFWITRKYKWKPFVQVSDKWKKVDGFWFALFHELAHVQLHLNKKDDMLINIDDNQEDKEKEANDWACNYFINKESFSLFLNNQPITQSWIFDFSTEQWVWVSILAWRLAHHYNRLWDNQAFRKVADFRWRLKVVNY